MLGHLQVRRASMVCLVGLLGFCGSVQAETLERIIPGDALITLSWDGLLDPASPSAEQIARVFAVFNRSNGGDIEAAAPVLNTLRLAAQSPGVIALLDVDHGSRGPDIQLVGCVRLGAQAAKLAELVDGWMAGKEERTIHGVRFRSASMDSGPGNLYWSANDGYFIAGVSEAGLERLLRQMAGEGASLAASDELQRAYRKTAVEPGKGRLVLHADATGLLKRFGEQHAGPDGAPAPLVGKLIQALGVDAVRGKTLLVADTDIGTFCGLFAHVVGERRGLLKLWNQQPLTDEDLSKFPADSYWVEVCNLDLTQLWSDALEVVEAVDPNAVPQVQAVMAMSTNFLGFSIPDQVFPALGDTWALYDAPSHGGLLGTGTVLVVEARKPEVLDGVIRHLVELIGPFVARDEMRLVTGKSTLAGRTVHHVVVGGTGSPLVFSWGFAGDRLVLGLMPQTVAAAMKELEQTRRETSVLSRKDVRAAMARLRLKTYQSFGYSDSVYFARMLYPVQMLLSNALASLSTAPDGVAPSFLMPMDDVVAQSFVRVGVGGADEDGIVWESIGSLDAGTLTAAGVGATTSVLLPSLARARHMARRTVSASNLRGIGMAMWVYANEHNNRMPEGLDPLLESGAVTEEMLSSPFAEEGEAAYRVISGLTTNGRLPAAETVLGYEIPHVDEGTNVLFLDGHVEWVDLHRFRDLVRRTYTALGRENEIPEEAR